MSAWVFVENTTWTVVDVTECVHRTSVKPPLPLRWFMGVECSVQECCSWWCRGVEKVLDVGLPRSNSAVDVASCVTSEASSRVSLIIQRILRGKRRSLLTVKGEEEDVYISCVFQTLFFQEGCKTTPRRRNTEREWMKDSFLEKLGYSGRSLTGDLTERIADVLMIRSTAKDQLLENRNEILKINLTGPDYRKVVEDRHSKLRLSPYTLDTKTYKMIRGLFKSITTKWSLHLELCTKIISSCTRIPTPTAQDVFRCNVETDRGTIIRNPECIYDDIHFLAFSTERDHAFVRVTHMTSTSESTTGERCQGRQAPSRRSRNETWKNRCLFVWFQEAYWTWRNPDLWVRTFPMSWRIRSWIQILCQEVVGNCSETEIRAQQRFLKTKVGKSSQGSVGKLQQGVENQLDKSRLEKSRGELATKIASQLWHTPCEDIHQFM